jgi:hypothetical protein
MKLQDVRDLEKDDFLGLLGIESKHSFTNRLLGTLGTFGVGLLVGAGVALLLAPKPGSELRHALRAKLHSDAKSATPNDNKAASASEAAHYQA